MNVTRCAFVLFLVLVECFFPNSDAHSNNKSNSSMQDQAGYDCQVSPRPSSGKLARLLMELIKSLEGEDGTITSTLTHQLLASRLLVQPSLLDTEPDLGSLVKSTLMMGQPHVYREVLGMVWLMATDVQGDKVGWCYIQKVNKFLSRAKPLELAWRFRINEPILEQSLKIIGDFVQKMNFKNPESREAKESSFHKMPSKCHYLDLPSDEWVFRSDHYRPILPESAPDGDCGAVQPSNRDIVENLCMLLPYFDKDHSNMALLQDLADVVTSLSDSLDSLESEAAMLASVLIPLVLLRNSEDTWCLLDKFRRALSQFQEMERPEKESSLQRLQKIRAVNEGIMSFIDQLSKPPASIRPQITTDDDDEDNLDDLKSNYLKDLMRSFG